MWLGADNMSMLAVFVKIYGVVIANLLGAVLCGFSCCRRHVGVLCSVGSWLRPLGKDSCMFSAKRTLVALKIHVLGR